MNSNSVTSKRKIFDYDCLKCNFRSNSPEVFRQHALSHIPELFRCEQCYFETNRRELFAVHKHDNDETDDALSNGTEHFSSVQVKKSFKSLKFKCLNCNFQSNSKGSLKLHSFMHNQQSYSCLQCDYKTNFQKLLNMHQQVHLDMHNQKQLKCSYCPYVTLRQCSLQRHMLVHESKELACPKCDFKSTSKEFLNEHMLLHSRKEAFNCPLCEFSTIQELKFQQHMKAHSNINLLESKTYKCSFCSFQSTSDTAFESHLLNGHAADFPPPKDNIKTTESSKLSEFNSLSSDNALYSKESDHSIYFESNKQKYATNQQGTTRNDLNTVASKKTLMNIGKSTYQPKASWTLAEKREIYWCYLFSKHKIFNSSGSSERQMKMLVKRGILNHEKLRVVPLEKITNLAKKIKAYKTKISEREIEDIEHDVEKYIKSHIMVNQSTT